MTVSRILATKGEAVYTVEATETLAEAAKLLSIRKIGAAVIIDKIGRVLGILSERDIVAAVAADGAGAMTHPVRDHMTTGIVTCTRRDRVEHLMAQMTEHRIRHIPVVESGKLLGIVSIGDVVKRRIEDAEHEANALKDYIAAR
jgi:CBS domain-containing protein